MDPQYLAYIMYHDDNTLRVYHKYMKQSVSDDYKARNFVLWEALEMLSTPVSSTVWGKSKVKRKILLKTLMRARWSEPVVMRARSNWCETGTPWREERPGAKANEPRWIFSLSLFTLLRHLGDLFKNLCRRLPAPSECVFSLAKVAFPEFSPDSKTCSQKIYQSDHNYTNVLKGISRKELMTSISMTKMQGRINRAEDINVFRQVKNKLGKLSVTNSEILEQLPNHFERSQC